MPNEEHHHLQKENLQYQNQNHLVYHKGLGSIRGYFGLNILEKLNTFVELVLDLHNLNVITCF